VPVLETSGVTELRLNALSSLSLPPPRIPFPRGLGWILGLRPFLRMVAEGHPWGAAPQCPVAALRGEDQAEKLAAENPDQKQHPLPPPPTWAEFLPT